MSDRLAFAGWYVLGIPDRGPVLFESLEQRRLLAITVGQDPDGTVRITGTGGVDLVEVTEDANDIIVTDNSAVPMVPNPKKYAKNGVPDIVADLQGGNDTAGFGNISKPVEANGGPGNDVINGGGAVDTLRGGADDDKLYGGGSGDYLYGEGGGDEIHGGNGNDNIDGGSGADELRGDDHDDYFFFNNDGWRDTIIGGQGYDVVEAWDYDDVISEMPD